MAASTPILVTGATGAQGGAVVTALLEIGLPVRALVRDPGSRAARALAARGVALAQGDFDDEARLAEAMAGAGGVFSVQMPPLSGDPDSELRTGRRLVAAARAAGVKVFVHSSVARAGDQQHFQGWSEGRWTRDYWNSKSGVNEAVEEAGFDHKLILKPAFMMDNFIPPKSAWMFPALAEGRIETAMTAETRMDLIAAADISRFAAAAFADPARFDGQKIDLASDSLTMDEIARILSDATGRTVQAFALTADEALARGLRPGLVSSQIWASVEGYRVDLARARSHGIPLISFADWARAHASDFAIGSA